MIVLSTLNTSYQNTAFGLRYLKANLQELESSCQILEFTTERPQSQVIEQILSANPRILGLGIYIWNAIESLELVRSLKQQAPDLIIVLGGPEVSYEAHLQEIVALADYTIQGEGDVQFYELCKKLLADEKPEAKVLSAKLPEIGKIVLPYRLYSDEDVKQRHIFVEASRGCPYKCEYCLSSLDKLVRNFPLENFLQELQILIDRGARQFKFIDRTFNLNITIGKRILEFFLSQIDKGLFLHFEMVPDRLPDDLKELLKKFPDGALQFEIGLQTFNPTVAALVSRKNDHAKVEENFRFLVSETTVHIHADLIAGLPGEDLDSFAVGFDRLAALQPHEIQVGILKRLRGTPIVRHDREWQMQYAPLAPYQIQSTKTMPAETIQNMIVYAKFWDLIANSGRFSATMKMIRSLPGSFFWNFWNLSQRLYQKFPQLQGINLLPLTEHLFAILKEQFDEQELLRALALDYSAGGKRTLPNWLKMDGLELPVAIQTTAQAPKRQQAHLIGRN